MKDHWWVPLYEVHYTYKYTVTVSNTELVRAMSKIGAINAFCDLWGDGKIALPDDADDAELVGEVTAEECIDED